MKILTLMPMALIALASCSDNDENVEDLVETAAVPMLADNVMMIAFGFYQEDNIGILSKDYVASVPDYKRGVSHYDIIGYPHVLVYCGGGSFCISCW